MKIENNVKKLFLIFLNHCDSNKIMGNKETENKRNLAEVGKILSNAGPLSFAGTNNS